MVLRILRLYLQECPEVRMYRWICKFRGWENRSSRWWLFWSFFFGERALHRVCEEYFLSIIFILVLQSQTIIKIIEWRKGWYELSVLWLQRLNWQWVARKINKQVEGEAMQDLPNFTLLPFRYLLQVVLLFSGWVMVWICSFRSYW